jgi:hypothetical protein
MINHTTLSLSFLVNNGCCCGCGTLVDGLFAQGHDAKLHGAVVKAARGAAPAPTLLPRARVWLRSRSWMTPQLAGVVALMPSVC